MKILILSLISLVSLDSFAVSQSELQLSEQCRKKIESAVYQKIGKGDDTFSVVGMKLLYGGSKGGLHFSPVVLVRTSDEVEPRDVIVITDWVSSKFADQVGCKVTHVVTVADGLTLEDAELGD